MALAAKAAKPQYVPNQKQKQRPASEETPYYVRNLERGVHTIAGATWSRDLFAPAELALMSDTLLGTVTNESPEAAALAVRMLCRQHGWCAVSDLRYSEIDDIAAAVVTLQEHTLVRVHGVTSDAAVPLPRVLAALKVPALRALRKKLGLSGAVPSAKSEQIAAIVGWTKSQRTLGGDGRSAEQLAMTRALEVTGDLVEIDLALHAIYRRMELVFFAKTSVSTCQGQLVKNFATITLAEVGKAVFPQYTVRAEGAAVWHCQCGLLAYEAALLLDARMEKAAEGDDPAEVIRLYRDGVEAPAPADADASTATGKATGAVAAGPARVRHPSQPCQPDPQAFFDMIAADEPRDAAPLSAPSASSTPLAAPAALTGLAAGDDGLANGREPISPAAAAAGKPGGWRLRQVNESCEFCRMDAVQARPLFLQRYSSHHVLTRVVTRAADALASPKIDEKHRAAGLLQMLLRQPLNPARRGRWCEKLALHLQQHLHRVDEALALCQSGIADPQVRTGHRLNLVARAERLCKAAKNPHLLPALATVPDARLAAPVEWTVRGCPVERQDGAMGHIRYLDGDVICRVEELVIRHEAKDGWRGAHCEGRLFGLLFRLLFWDIIYADVPGVFITPYQHRPLDFGLPDFYVHRQHLVDRRLRQIRGGDASEMVRQAWAAHMVAPASGDNDADADGGGAAEGEGEGGDGGKGKGKGGGELFTAASIVELAGCIGAEVIARVLWVLACDYNKRSGGLPDLVLWRPNTMQARFVEVKSPSDRLSETQRVWIQVLSDVGADVSVARVTHAGAGR